MATVHVWTGLEALALRRALRMSVRAFAEHLGVAVRTVSKWEKLGVATQPRPDTQAILDVALGRADNATHLRFETLLSEQAQLPGRELRVTTAGSRLWEYETWADDLDRIVVALSRQSFAYAENLLGRWLLRFQPLHLDRRGLYLFARSLALLGDLRRDRGALLGPMSANSSYTDARNAYTQLDIPRRIAQLDLSLAVVTEMSGQVDHAAHTYEDLAVDDRLSPLDRARARLWVGTALSKQGEHDYAARVMTLAIRDFEGLDEPDDWSVAHQKLALARRGAGDLTSALQLIDVARSTAATDAPLQKVRLDTAYGHILLSDPVTVDDGLKVLDHAELIAAQVGLAHQLRAIEDIRRAGNPGVPGTRQGKRRQMTHNRMIDRRTPAEEQLQQARLIWDYHQMHHQVQPCDAAIGLGSHDLGVADVSAELYHQGMFPLIVFSGSNSPTTAARFPRGEAVHYRERAVELGVPPEAILLEPKAANTGDNITLSRQVLADADTEPNSVLLISKPYMERRAFATCRKVWPEVDVVCASESLTIDDYLRSISDDHLVVDMLVGDLQRVIEYPKLGYAIEQDVPGDVYDAYKALIHAGFDSRLIKP